MRGTLQSHGSHCYRFQVLCQVDWCFELYDRVLNSLTTSRSAPNQILSSAIQNAVNTYVCWDGHTIVLFLFCVKQWHTHQTLYAAPTLSTSDGGPDKTSRSGTAVDLKRNFVVNE